MAHLKKMKYKHDCPDCKFLKTFKPTNNLDLYYADTFDLYYCKKGLEMSFSARFGNEEIKKFECGLYSIKSGNNSFQSLKEAYLAYSEETKSVNKG
jgi:hypothetical protein